MRETLRRIGHDLKHLHNLDAYAVALVAFAFAALSFAGDALSTDSRWAVLLAGMGLLAFRMTLPDRYDASADDLLMDRTAFEQTPFSARLRNANELWIFAPSAVNLLSPQTCETIRTTILDNPDGAVRIAVLDPAETTAVELAGRQLDDSLDHPSQIFKSSLEATVRQMQRINSWAVRGDFEYRFLGYNPGFSLIAIDPSSRKGIVIVEFHAFHNQSTGNRMHIELNRDNSDEWYRYWVEQFERIWDATQPPQ